MLRLCILALAAVLAGGANVLAGPIEWKYRVAAGVDWDVSPVLWLGSIEVYHHNYRHEGHTTLRHRIEINSLALPVEFAGSGDGSLLAAQPTGPLVLGTIGTPRLVETDAEWEQHFGDYDGKYRGNPYYKAQIEITDGDSGEVATADFLWLSDIHWEQHHQATYPTNGGGPGYDPGIFDPGSWMGKDAWSSEPIGWEAGEKSQTLLLGANRYDIRTFGRGSDLVAEVYVTPAVETPEPASLLMAGLGLAAVATRRRRARAKTA